MVRRYAENLHPRGHGGKWVKKGMGVTGRSGDDDSGPDTKATAKPPGRKPAAPPARDTKPATGKDAGRPKAKAPTAEQAKGFIDGHYGDWKNNLTPAQEKGVRFYQSPGFALMNGQLRGLDAGGLKKSERASDADMTRARAASKNLTAAIKTAPPLKEPTTVYRGFSADQFGKLEAGQTITDKGFVSTSLTDDAGAVGKASRKATAEITLPAGTKAAAGSARELVLPPGAKFKVTSVTTRGGNPHVVMEYVPPAGGRKAVTASLADLGDAEDQVLALLVELYFDEIAVDGAESVTADAMPVSRMPAQLQRSYVAGKVAQRIRWGVPGDFKRCVTQARIHGMGRKAEGACAMLHHKALGVWPGREHGKK